MDKATMTKDLIGKRVFFRSTWVDVCEGIVEGIEGDFLAVDCRKPGPGHCGVHVEDAFLTKEELMEHNRKRADAKTEAYCAKITDVESLVKFCYDNTVSCAEEYTNYEARAAVRRRAKELLGIELEG